jgi:hypothetical protein
MSFVATRGILQQETPSIASVEKRNQKSDYLPANKKNEGVYASSFS